MGVSYRGYCANVARTILVDPPKKVQEAYKALTGAFEAALEAMRPGEPLKGVPEAVKAYLEKKAPEYLPYLPKTFGSCIGAFLPCLSCMPSRLLLLLCLPLTGSTMHASPPS